MKRLLKAEIMLPVMLIIGIVAVAAYATYFAPAGPWYVAYYRDSGSNAFNNASHFAESVTTADTHSVTVYISDPHKLQELKASGAYLIDPKGISLCSQN